MRRLLLCLALATVTGCRSTPNAPAPIAPPPTSSSQSPGASLAEMEAEYAKLRAANEKRCLYATPAEIRARQAECAAERHRMAPLGNALIEAEQKEAQRRANQ